MVKVAGHFITGTLDRFTPLEAVVYREGGAAPDIHIREGHPMLQSVERLWTSISERASISEQVIYSKSTNLSIMLAIVSLSLGNKISISALASSPSSAHYSRDYNLWSIISYYWKTSWGIDRSNAVKELIFELICVSIEWQLDRLIDAVQSRSWSVITKPLHTTALRAASTIELPLPWDYLYAKITFTLEYLHPEIIFPLGILLPLHWNYLYPGITFTQELLLSWDYLHTGIAFTLGLPLPLGYLYTGSPLPLYHGITITFELLSSWDYFNPAIAFALELLLHWEKLFLA